MPKVPPANCWRSATRGSQLKRCTRGNGLFCQLLKSRTHVTVVPLLYRTVCILLTNASCYVQKLTVCDTASWQSFSRTRKQWNTHHIRPSAAARCPTGIPDELVLLISGGSVCILSQYVLLWLLVLMCPQSSLWVGMENAVSCQAGQSHTERRFSHGTKVRFAIGTARPHTVSRHGSHHPQLAMRKN